MRPPRYRYQIGPAAIACLAAGPIFVLTLVVGDFVQDATHQSVPLGPGALTALPFALMLLMPVLVVGTFLALVPVAVGTLALSYLADLSDVAAEPPLWLVAGAAMAGGAGAWIAEGQPLVIAALAVTGGLVAALCHRGLEPIEDEYVDAREPARIRDASAA